jgi:uncharacterized membrane protein
LAEWAAIVVIVAGALVASGASVWRAFAKGLGDAVRFFREGFGRAILLSLELLVAADIIRTLSEAPTLRGVIVLALIVLVRTFLSFTLEVELTGHWPWRKPDR